ncbi:hypothetical protein GCM10023065_31530 [Microbacterium laevaniformans]
MKPRNTAARTMAMIALHSPDAPATANPMIAPATASAAVAAADHSSVVRRTGCAGEGGHGFLGVGSDNVAAPVGDAGGRTDGCRVTTRQAATPMSTNTTPIQ